MEERIASLKKEKEEDMEFRDTAKNDKEMLNQQIVALIKEQEQLIEDNKNYTQKREDGFRESLEAITREKVDIQKESQEL